MPGLTSSAMSRLLWRGRLGIMCYRHMRAVLRRELFVALHLAHPQNRQGPRSADDRLGCRACSISSNCHCRSDAG